jgi:hypothetical protein
MSKSKLKNFFADMTTTTSECSEFINTENNICSDKNVILALKDFVISQKPEEKQDISEDNDTETVDKAKKILGCSSESCVVVNPIFKNYVINNNLLKKSDLDKNLAVRFKPFGPRNSFELLSNVHIDETLQRWSISYPFFYPCTFAMMDFDQTEEPFSKVSLIKIYEGTEDVHINNKVYKMQQPARCFGCVINTDISTGKGKHWVAIFVDMRSSYDPWTIEYFNSSGQKPPNPMMIWIKRTEDYLNKYRKNGGVISIRVTSIQHQTSKTECGLYALYYIRRRLDGTSYKYFQSTTVPDAVVTEFRKHLFRYS